jgi:hypothetical protein
MVCTEEAGPGMVVFDQRLAYRAPPCRALQEHGASELTELALLAVVACERRGILGGTATLAVTYLGEIEQ